MINRGDLDIVNDLVDVPFFNRSLKVRVFPEFDFSVFSSSDKVLSVLVDIQGIDRSVMSSDRGLALAKDRPGLNKPVPSNSNKVIALRVLRNSQFGNSISMSWVSGLSLELSKSVPYGGLVIESSRIDDFRINRDSARIDLFLRSEESLLESSIDNVPESHGLIPRTREEGFISSSKT